MLFEYMVIILLYDESLCSDYAMSACQPAGKMLYINMLRIEK